MIWLPWLNALALCLLSKAASAGNGVLIPFWDILFAFALWGAAGIIYAQFRVGVLLYALLLGIYQVVLLVVGDWSPWSLPLDLIVLAIGGIYWPQLKRVNERSEWPMSV